MIAGGREGWSRWLRSEERGLRLGLYTWVLVVFLLMDSFPDTVGAIVLMLPLLAGTLLLSPRHVPPFAVTILGVLFLVTVLSYGTSIPSRRLVGFVAAVSMVALVLTFNRRRSGLGVAGYASDSLLTELHTRLRRQAVMPPLPGGWHAESHLRAAGGTEFAGDFLLTHLERGERLHLVVVDVSGKGVDAGPRSLLLSGAFGGLLARSDPADFLPAANGYVWRQDWPDSFASAIQLTLDLHTGDFVLRSAGHPPAVHLQAGSGRWKVYEDYEGPVLGILEEASYDAVFGRMLPGDALLLFTDGLIEQARRDLSIGIDKLIGEGERTVASGFEGVAAELVERLGARSDDCALVVIHRYAAGSSRPAPGVERMTGIEPA